MNNLPDAETLHVEEKKVTGYLLNLDHDEGGSKAQFFSDQGFTLTEWESFAQALRQHGRTQPVTEQEATRHGQKYVVECQLVSPDGHNPCILSVWIKEGTKPPRLVTAHPNS